jgi:hypothetical protein
VQPRGGRQTRQPGRHAARHANGRVALSQPALRQRELAKWLQMDRMCIVQ